ncbi:hypothetical protein BLNAU_20409 [Blattamonas nauphoetae]|uniref:Uncharacterized protein n=1 Tax=Blattamonas nauphoetae TaxID=2049346 RepID=A0ABQ9WYS4_9EUKA|nr:hypothetical protein BLNAU_20409 [Blattamonas nauphoetae]
MARNTPSSATHFSISTIALHIASTHHSESTHSTHIVVTLTNTRSLLRHNRSPQHSQLDVFQQKLNLFRRCSILVPFLDQHRNQPDSLSCSDITTAVRSVVSLSTPKTPPFEEHALSSTTRDLYQVTDVKKLLDTRPAEISIAEDRNRVIQTGGTPILEQRQARHHPPSHSQCWWKDGPNEETVHR